MYAHHVIDDILLDEWKNYRTPEVKKYIRDLAGAIGTAQKFHLDCLGTLKETSVPLIGQSIFPEGTHLPYLVSYFDYTFPKDWGTSISETQFPRGAILAVDYETHIFMQVFLYVAPYGNKGRWVAYPIYTMLYKNGTSATGVVSEHMVKTDTDIDNMEKDCQVDLNILGMALRLLSCKNITTEQTQPSEKLNRVRKKRGRSELFTYHTIVIKPVGRYQEGIPKYLWSNRIHLCRGHFKEYTEERKLLGKHTGRYWWQPQARGRNKDGIVMKDYLVKP